MNSEEQLEIYGKILTGLEKPEDLDLVARTQYLKLKVRRLLQLNNIGDPLDVATDINKSLLLGVGILAGVITNAAIITRYKAYVTAQVQLYGGPGAIMDKLEANAVILEKWLGKLNDAKAEIAEAKSGEDLAVVDVEDIEKAKLG
jgi:hypothetical protein